jgi:hypothetical protein
VRRYSTDDRIEAAVRWLIKNGWHTKSSKRHLRLQSDDGKHCLTVATSPSDPHSYWHFLRDLRQLGIDLRRVI